MANKNLVLKVNITHIFKRSLVSQHFIKQHFPNRQIHKEEISAVHSNLRPSVCDSAESNSQEDFLNLSYTS